MFFVNLNIPLSVIPVLDKSNSLMEEQILFNKNKFFNFQ